MKPGNPLSLSGYRSIAAHPSAVLAVIRGQVQHHSAVRYTVPEKRLRIFETYSAAAAAVRDGRVDAYASVARAHGGFIAENPGWGLEYVEVPHSEKPPAFGCFAIGLSDSALCARVDEILEEYLGSPGPSRNGQGLRIFSGGGEAGRGFLTRIHASRR